MKSHRGRKDRHEWEERVRYILRHLDDPIMLQKSPIARLAVVEKRATKTYPNGLVPRGQALKDLVKEWLEEVESVAGDGPFKNFVLLTTQGEGTMEASRKLGVSPSYVSRTYKKQLVQLLVKRIAGIELISYNS